MHMVRFISDWVVVMAEGKLVAEGKPGHVMQNQAVIDAYLGSHHDQDLGDDSVLDEDFDTAVAEEKADSSKEKEALEAYADSVRAQEGDEN
jgi:neutral amino acid transport system ATP-binding protein